MCDGFRGKAVNEARLGRVARKGTFRRNSKRAGIQLNDTGRQAFEVASNIRADGKLDDGGS